MKVEAVEIRCEKLMEDGKNYCKHGERECFFLIRYRFCDQIIPECVLRNKWERGIPTPLEHDGENIIPHDECFLKKCLAPAAKPVRKQAAVKQEFIPPTAEEIAAYAAEIGFAKLDVQKFIDHYSAKGWKIGSTKVKDWRACVRTWHARDGMYNTVQRSRYNNNNGGFAPEKKGLLVV